MIYNKKDWNPDLYLKFGKERIQPSIDLVSRIDFDKPSKIIDIGCGPGNSTQILHQRWSDSKIIGVDNSRTMIDRAKKDFPNQEWQLINVGNDTISGKYDIVFSNAVIQWIPNHLELFQTFSNILSDNGIVAIQVPLFFDMPLGRSIARISKKERWPKLTKNVNNLFTIHNRSKYYDMLSEVFSTVEIWESDYIHIMDSQYSILKMIKSTGLKPYLDTLEVEKDKNNFEEMVLNDIKIDYPIQKNGNVLLVTERVKTMHF